jgi:hypothetical protein
MAAVAAIGWESSGASAPALASVRELESIAFANRPASDPGAPSAEVARITTVFQQLQFDGDTLRERERRGRMVR